MKIDCNHNYIIFWDNESLSFYNKCTKCGYKEKIIKQEYIHRYEELYQNDEDDLEK